MATKKEIASDLQKQYGPLVTASQAAAILGYRDRSAVKAILRRAGVPYYDLGGGKRQYYTLDIARFIDSCRVDS